MEAQNINRSNINNSELYKKDDMCPGMLPRLYLKYVASSLDVDKETGIETFIVEVTCKKDLTMIEMFMKENNIKYTLR